MDDRSWTILRSATDYRRMPWKNGGGETVEIAVFPDGATVADFDWRISMATVASDGPFSSFPGVDRTLSILEGEGMVLDIGAETVRLTGDDAPLPFPADVTTAARLIEGAITDLNVMTKRSAFSHRVRKLTVSGEQRLTSDADRLLVFCHRGDVALRADGLDVRLSALDMAAAPTQRPVELTCEGEAQLFLIEISGA